MMAWWWIVLSLSALVVGSTAPDARRLLFDRYMRGFTTIFRANTHPRHIPMTDYRDVTGDGSFDSTRLDVILNVTVPAADRQRGVSSTFGDYVQHTSTMGYFEVVCLNGQPGGLVRREWSTTQDEEPAEEWMAAELAARHFCGADSSVMDRMGQTAATSAARRPDNELFGLSPRHDPATVVCPDGRRSTVSLDSVVSLLTQLTKQCDCEQCLFFEGLPGNEGAAVLPFQVPGLIPWGFWTAAGLPTVFHGLTLDEATNVTHAAVFPPSTSTVAPSRLSGAFRCISRGSPGPTPPDQARMRTTWLSHLKPYYSFFDSDLDWDVLLSTGIWGKRTDTGWFIEMSSEWQSNGLPSETMFLRLLHHWSAGQPPCDTAPIDTVAWELRKHHTPKRTSEALLNVAGLKSTEL